MLFEQLIHLLRYSKVLRYLVCASRVTDSASLRTTSIAVFLLLARVRLCLFRQMDVHNLSICMEMSCVTGSCDVVAPYFIELALICRSVGGNLLLFRVLAVNICVYRIKQ